MKIIIVRDRRTIGTVESVAALKTLVDSGRVLSSDSILRPNAATPETVADLMSAPSPVLQASTLPPIPAGVFPFGTGQITVRRNGQTIGAFRLKELQLLISRQDGGLLLTDEVFDAVQGKWRRLSDMFTSPLRIGWPLSLFILAAALLIILRLAGGSWSAVWELFGIR